MIVGLMGFEFVSSNKGCEALSYSIMPILERIIDDSIEVIVFWKDDLGAIPSMYPQITFKSVDVKLKKLNNIRKLIKEIKRCDVLLDITHGDSFSDIYGSKWFIRTTLVKQIVLINKKPLVLLPQTYGPYKSKLAKNWATHIISKAEKVYCRDKESYLYLKKNIKSKYLSKIKVYTDLAFALPYKKYNKKDNDILKIGLNISGLLWNDSENDNNFKLKSNYKEFCDLLIEKLLTLSNVNLTLIPHVICDSREGYDYYENDCRAISKLIEKYPRCMCPENIKNAIDAKNVIASQDVFIGARMHATIGAFSSGVPCIPFSYSRKFEGLYNDLKYFYVIDGKKETAAIAVNKIIDSINNIDKLERDRCNGMKKVKNCLERFEKDLQITINSRG